MMRKHPACQKFAALLITYHDEKVPGLPKICDLDVSFGLRSTHMDRLSLPWSKTASPMLPLRRIARPLLLSIGGYSMNLIVLR